MLQFSAHICCGHMAAWSKMSLGMELSLSPGDSALDGDPVPLPQKGAESPPKIFGPCLLWPNSWMHQGATWHEFRPQPRRLCARWGPTPSHKGGGARFLIFGPYLLWPNGWMGQVGTWHGGRHWSRPLFVQKGAEPAQFSAHLYCGQTSGCIKMPFGMEVGFSPDDFVLDGDPAPTPKGAETPNFRPTSIMAKRLHGSRCHLVRR